MYKYFKILTKFLKCKQQCMINDLVLVWLWDMGGLYIFCVSVLWISDFRKSTNILHFFGQYSYPCIPHILSMDQSEQNWTQHKFPLKGTLGPWIDEYKQFLLSNVVLKQQIQIHKTHLRNYFLSLKIRHIKCV